MHQPTLGDRLIVTLPQDILFATDSTQVSIRHAEHLAALARNVNVYSNSHAQVIGHTDSDGHSVYNQQLSKAVRAGRRKRAGVEWRPRQAVSVCGAR